MNKNIRYIILAALSLLTTATATAQRELHLYSHYVDSAYVWATFDASRVDSIKVIDHIDVAPAWIQAKVEGYRIHITWEGVENVPCYTVYRSRDGENWTTVAWTEGTCEAYDNYPFPGTNYYKVCARGLSNYEGPFSEVTSVEAEAYIFAHNTFFLPMVAQGRAHDDFGFMSRLLALDVMSEDIAFGGLHYFQYDYQLDYWGAQYVRTADYWNSFYSLIMNANETIRFLKDSPATTGEKWLLAQAYALRGMAYMYLIQVYSDYMTIGVTEGEITPINREAKGVPILYSEYDGKTADEIEAAKGRNTVGDVLDEIERNLWKAAELYNYGRDAKVKNYTPTREFISYPVLCGLLARYHLLVQNWDYALEEAWQATLFSNFQEHLAHDLTDGFMDIHADDVLWGFDHTADTQTKFCSFFSHMSNDTPGYAGMNYCAKLIDARLYAQIPDNDLRKQLFNGPDGDRYAANPGARKPYAARKFGFIDDWSMDYIYMRQAEMVLIMAECLARLGRQSDNVEEVIKNMMNQYMEGGWDAESLSVDDVLLQRRIELWGEGFSFFDLKRLNKGIDRNYDGSNHLDDCRLTVPAHDTRWTYKIPSSAFNDNYYYNLDPETDQNP